VTSLQSCQHPASKLQYRFIHYPLEACSELARTSSDAHRKYQCRFHYAKAGAKVHKCATKFYDELRWVNTSAVESVDSFLKRFRTLGWYSGLESFMVFLLILYERLQCRPKEDGRCQIGGSCAGEAVEQCQQGDAVRRRVGATLTPALDVIRN
jgi:hypothetical protein